MGHTIDLENYSLRTDIIFDVITEQMENDLNLKKEQFGNIKVEEILIEEKLSKSIGKKEGYYKSISFADVTDKENYLDVQKVFCKTLKTMLEECNIEDHNSCLIIGLGNKKSTPDSLGPNVLNHILVTRHLFMLGEVENGYRNTSLIEPNVTGVTGIETFNTVNGIVKETNPDFVIIVDALASSSISRVNKMIQLSSAGIEPGSGVFNNRMELSEKTLGIPVIVIGIPTVVDATTIVSDTFQYMMRQFKYKIDKKDSSSLKLIPEFKQDYLNHKEELNKEEKEDLLGIIGTLSKEEFKLLINEVLTPINSNLMVTPKEVDFVIEKFASLIGTGINKVLHQNEKLTN